MGVGVAIAGIAAAGATIYAAEQKEDAIQAAAEQRAKANKRVINWRKEAFTKALQFQKHVFQAQQEASEPWREVGVQAIQTLQQKVQSGAFDPGEFGFTFRDFEYEGNVPEAGDFKFKFPEFNYQQSPAYQFKVNQAMQALDRSAAANGLLLSGAQIRRAEELAHDLAMADYRQARQAYRQRYRHAYRRARQEHRYAYENARQEFVTARQAYRQAKYNAFQRALAQYKLEAAAKTDAYNRLANLSGIGQTANQTVAVARGRFANNIRGARADMTAGVANNLINIGQARAAGYRASAKTYTTYGNVFNNLVGNLTTAALIGG